MIFDFRMGDRCVFKRLVKSLSIKGRYRIPIQGTISCEGLHAVACMSGRGDALDYHKYPPISEIAPWVSSLHHSGDFRAPTSSI